MGHAGADVDEVRDRALRPSSLRNVAAALAARNGAHRTTDRTGAPDEEDTRLFVEFERRLDAQVDPLNGPPDVNIR